MTDSETSPWFRHTFVFLYFLSGVISISFEVLWSRYLSLQFGVSIFGVVLTVAAFMFGLGGGSLFMARFLQRVKRPALGFALMESLVACFALLMPWIFKILGEGMETLAAPDNTVIWYGLQFLTTLCVLILPAFAMGCGFPMVLKALGSHGQPLAKTYGFNALGGVLGALLPLFLLPSFGWLGANQAVAILGLMVAISALVLHFKTYANLGEEPKTQGFAPSLNPFPLKTMFLYGLVGAFALALEIAWSRLFGMVLLRTEYVLAIVLASFLVGIGSGSLVSRYLRSPLWFSILPFIAGSFGIATLWLLPVFSAWVERTPFQSLYSALATQGTLLGVMLLPVTLALGAWLPLLTLKLGGGGRLAGALYGANSLGAGLGVLLTGFVLVPFLGSSIVIVLAAILLCITGLSWAENRRKWFVPLLLPLFAAPVFAFPQVASLLPLAQGESRDLFVSEDAVSITHVVQQKNGQRLLLSDLQRMDASSEPEAVVLQKNQARLGLLLHPTPQNVLFMGLGTGITASVMEVYPTAKAQAVELSAGAITAAQQYFAPVNGGISNHIEVVRDDIRHYLMATDSKYDVILGDLFHPDMVGRGVLLTRQHFQRVKNKLNTDGIFVQWISLNQFDLDAFKVVLRTFRQVFPDAYLWVDGFRVALVAASDDLEAVMLHKSFGALPAALADELSGGEGLWTWLGRYWGRIPQLKGSVQDEWAPVLEYQLPQARFAGNLDVITISRWLLAHRPAVGDAVSDLNIPEQYVADFSQAYNATGQAYKAWAEILGGLQQKGLTTMRQAYALNPTDRWVADALANSIWDQLLQVRQKNINPQQVFGRQESEVIEAVLRLAPDHVGALKALWQQARVAGNADLAASYRQHLVRISPFDSDLKGSLTD